MDNQIPSGLIHHIRSMAVIWQDDRGDNELLTAFADFGDQAAFTTLVCRHGAAVWAVCRSILTDCADAEDAFQATFITLARRSRTAHPESVAGWLVRVARSAAVGVRKASRRREVVYQQLYEQATSQLDETSKEEEFRAAVHEELAGLPLGLRAPLSLYYLEGKTQPEISRILGMARQTVSYRIQKGLGELRRRLSNRGMVVTVTALVAILGGMPVASAVPTGLIASTTEAACRAVADGATSASIGGMTAVGQPVVGAVLSTLTKTVMVGLVIGMALVGGFWPRSSTENMEVSGSVLMDREPLERAEVVLMPDHGHSPVCKSVSALTDQNGRFCFLIGLNAGEVAPGRYRVLVSDPYGSRVPSDYHVPLHTPLRLDVDASPVVFDIPITSVIRPKPFLQSDCSPELNFRPKQLSAVGVGHKGDIWPLE